jgi:hypothetical protein
MWRDDMEQTAYLYEDLGTVFNDSKGEWVAYHFESGCESRGWGSAKDAVCRLYEMDFNFVILGDALVKDIE